MGIADGKSKGYFCWRGSGTFDTFESFAAMKRQLTDMLTHYRAQNLLNPVMAAIQAEFQAMPEADQRELLFWMVIDVAKNPTKVAPNVPAGTA